MRVADYRTEQSPIGPKPSELEPAPAKAATAPAKTPRDRDAARMNKTEARYAHVLEYRQRAGEVRRYWFEALTWRLADRTHYRTDFLVEMPDGRLEIHEVKGRKGETFYATEDAWLKLKLVARECPIPVIVMWPRKEGGWSRRDL